MIIAHRWLVCGSRDFLDVDAGLLILSHVADMIGMTPNTVISGAAPGADGIGAAYAHQVKEDVLAFGAQWRHHGNSAGPIRNKQMLDEGQPELVVALLAKPLEQSRGTFDMVKRSAAAGVPVLTSQWGVPGIRWYP